MKKSIFSFWLIGFCLIYGGVILFGCGEKKAPPEKIKVKEYKKIVAVPTPSATIDLSGKIDKSTLLAEWNSGIVTPTSFMDYFNNFLIYNDFATQSPNETDWVVNIIDSIILNYEIAKKARKEQIHLEKDYLQWREQEAIPHLLNQIAYREMVLKQIKYTYSDYNEMYQEISQDRKSPLSFRMRHILITPPEGVPEAETKHKAKEQADKIYKLLTQGLNFAEAARKYSASKASDPGLIFGPFVKGEISPLLEEVVLSLKPGEFSKPVEINNNYEIIQLVELTPEKMPPADDLRYTIETRLWEKLRNQRTQKVIEGLMNVFDVETNWNLLADKNLPGTAVLFKINAEPFTLDDLMAALPEQKRTNKDPKFLREVAEKELAKKLFVLQANKMEFYNLPEFYRRLKLYEEAELTKRYRKRFVDVGISITDEDIEAYYKEHLDLFKTEEARECYQLYIYAEDGPNAPRGRYLLAMQKAKDKIKQIAQEIANGLSFIEAVRKYSEAPSKEKDGYLGFVEPGPMGHRFDEAAFALQPGEISKPVKMRDGYQLIMLKEIRPSRQKELSEVKEEIKETLYFIRLAEKRAQIQKEILKAAQIKYNQKSIKIIAIELVNKAAKPFTRYTN